MKPVDQTMDFRYTLCYEAEDSEMTYGQLKVKSKEFVEEEFRSHARELGCEILPPTIKGQDFFFVLGGLENKEKRPARVCWAAYFKLPQEEKICQPKTWCTWLIKNLQTMRLKF